MKLALAGDVALNPLAPYFREAGFDTYVGAGFGSWRQEMLDPSSGMSRFNPDIVFDVTAHDHVLSREIPGFFDERMRKLASMPYSLDGIHALVEEAKWAACAKPCKVLAVDADNTLWRGIIGDEGPDGVAAYDDFQRGLISLKERGAALVLLSKNTPPQGAFIPPSMPLADTDFASRKINWQAKSLNLAEACEELNVGLDSVVFVDDSSAERAEMAHALPMVSIPPFPCDLASPSQFLRRLGEYFFSSMGRTREDALRADDYSANSEREKLRAKFGTVEGYLSSLELRASVRLAQEVDISRLAQLSSKSNQFNATTIRRSETDFAALIIHPAKRVFTIEAQDRFARQGIVGYVIVDIDTRTITDFVMSCRVMARTLEYFILQRISSSIGFAPQIDYIKTAKNAPFAQFLASLVSHNPPGKTFYESMD